MSEVSLSQLITPSKTVTLDFPGMEGFTVDLCHQSRESLLKIRKSCVTTKFDRQTRLPLESLNEEKFVNEYCSAIVKGWKGLKYSYLEELLLVDVSAFSPDDELPFTLDNLVLMMKNVDSFEKWVEDSVGDLQNFTKSK